MAATSLAGSISTNLAFVTKVPLLMKATSNDEKPTQGYVLQEISNISKASLSHCQSLLNFLFGRLEKKSPHIKYKVLHIMKYLVINGHSEFRSKLRHNSEVIKPSTSFGGELDPIHGDGLNINVRKAASELELLLFDVDNPEVEIIYKSLVAPNQLGEKMEGFGCNGAPAKKQPSFKDAPKIIKESVSGLYRWNTTKHFETSSFHQSSYTSKRSYSPVHLTSHQEDCGEETTHNTNSCGTFSDEHCSETLEKTDENTVCHYYERKLVNEVTAKGGVRSTPSKETLKDFVDKSSSLDFQVILQLLDEKLQEPSPNVQLKSLCVLEYLLRCRLKNISRSINDHCDTIQSLVTCDNNTVQAKAKKDRNELTNQVHRWLKDVLAIQNTGSLIEIALTITSCLNQEELDRAEKVSSPPNYDLAKDLPNIENIKTVENEKKETKKDEGNAAVESLFSGMKFSMPSPVHPTMRTTPETHAVSDAGPDLLGLKTESTDQGTETSYGFGANYESRNSVDSFDPLIHLENTQPRAASTPGNSTLDLFSNTEDYKSNVKPLEARTQNIENTTRVDLLTLQPSIPNASIPFFHAGLVPSTNITSSSSERRPFPKDMKQEVVGFGFLRKSSKKDAFSFVNDEMEARKTTPE